MDEVVDAAYEAMRDDWLKDLDFPSKGGARKVLVAGLGAVERCDVPCAHERCGVVEELLGLIEEGT